MNARLDRVETEKEIWDRAMTEDGKLKPDLVAKGMRVQREPMANIAYTTFNMEDAVIGAPPMAYTSLREFTAAICPKT